MRACVALIFPIRECLLAHRVILSLISMHVFISFAKRTKNKTTSELENKILDIGSASVRFFLRRVFVGQNCVHVYTRNMLRIAFIFHIHF